MAIHGEIPIHFRSDGITCRGILRFSDPSVSRGQTIVLCPGLGGTQDSPVVQRAVTSFSAAGYNTFTFDYRSFGASDGHPRQVASVVAQLHDIEAAVGALSHHGTIDVDQLVLWGTSLGGAHAIVSANAAKARAVIAQMPFVGVAGRPRAIDAARFGAAIAADRVRRMFRLPPCYIPLVARPGHLAAMTTDHADSVVDSFRGTSWNNEVAAGVLLDLSRYRPVSHAATTPPLLVCMGEDDSLTPRDLIDALVADAPDCTLEVLSMGHFGLDGPAAHDALAAVQIDFLDRVFR